jgi:A/G-specific adenine glycosylase
VQRFRRKLLAWYEAHARNLPWRETTDPYRVWVSEIMLQQTRVAAVLEHYARFIKRFPTVAALANAREESVLAIWSGLGYYHRARRMHQAAKVVVRERGGQLPSRSGEWIELPGIGRYTAAAVASIAFGEPVAVVDGNVERVLARLNGDGSMNASPWESAQALLDSARPGDSNQAMMELGATLCTPRSPQCLLCPISTFCTTRGERPPVKQAPRKRKQLSYALVEKQGAVLLVRRRSDARLMADMWELPQLAEAPIGVAPLARLRHSITDTDYEVQVFPMPELHLANSRWMTAKQRTSAALTGLARKCLNSCRPPGLSRRPRLGNQTIGGS